MKKKYFKNFGTFTILLETEHESILNFWKSRFFDGFIEAMKTKINNHIVD